MKVQTYSEYAALLCAARRVGRPVRWCATRLESFLTDTHGRDGLLEAELALDAGGRFLGLRARTFVGIGAYTTTFAAIFSTANTKNCLSSVYVIPAIHIGVKMVLTNAAPLGPYRGAGRPEAIYLLERLIDRAARAMDIDRAELRRRNLIPPRRCRTGRRTGRSTTAASSRPILERALALADWKGFGARRRASRRSGKLRGIGIGCFLEVAGGILDETVDLRFEADGKVALRTGAQAMGQGHLSTFVPLVARRLGVDPQRGAAGRGRQRRGARRHAERRLALDHDGGQRHRASPATRRSRRAGAAPPTCSRPTPATSSSPTACSGWSAPTAPFRSSISRPHARSGNAGGARRRARHRRQVRLPADELPERMPHLRGRDRPGNRGRRRGRPIPRSMTSATCCTRRSCGGRSTAAWRKASGRCSASRWSTATTASC